MSDLPCFVALEARWEFLPVGRRGRVPRLREVERRAGGGYDCCPCARCSRRRALDARTARARALRQLKGEPTSLVDAEAAAARLRRVLDLGWSYNALEQFAGGEVRDATLRLIVEGVTRRIEPRTERAVLAIPYTLAPAPSMPSSGSAPILGARRRVQGLLQLGWRHADLRPLGIESSHVVRGTYATIRVGKWREVDAVFRDLCMKVGPSEKTRARAARAGFASPLAWDDIDDPDEVPTGTGYEPASRLELLEDLLERGATITDVCRRLHVTRDSLQQWCARRGLEDLYHRAVAPELMPGMKNQHIERVAS